MKDSNKLRELLDSANPVLAKAARTNGAAASERTQELTQKVIYKSLRELHGLGYRLEHVDNLADRHLEVLMKHWWAKGNAPKTIENNFSRMRQFIIWMGKRSMLRKGGRFAYLPDVPREAQKVKTYTEETKSWSGNGVNVEVALETARMDDVRWYSMLLLELFFGLRQKEVLGIKPWEADKGKYLNIDGNIAKGGRPRVIIMEDNATGQFQRQVLDYVKRQCRRNEALCWPGRTMEQGRKRYFHLMRKHGLTKAELGVTGHGLRAEYAENEALRQGLLPPSLGGTRHQLPKEQMQEISLRVSNNLGHNDLHTIGAYYGSFRKAKAHIWTRTGSVVLDEDRVATVFTDPPLIEEPDGSYKAKTAEERARIAICVRIEAGGSLEKELDLEAFAQAWPQKEGKLLQLLQARGLRAA